MLDAPVTTQSPPRAVALDAVQRLTAERMMQSHLGAARVSILGDAEASGLAQYFEKRAADLRAAGIRLTYTHLLVRIVAMALRRHPHVNASLQENELRLHEQINVGVAFAAPDGQLVVPVVHDADGLSVEAIATRLTELQARVQTRKLGLTDVRGGTFTLTNLGMFAAVSYTTPLINLPQCAILGVGRLRDAWDVVEGKPVSRKLLGLSLTHDHRILNGYPAAAFFQTVADIVADPAQIEAA